jgi:hypothetical protein
MSLKMTPRMALVLIAALFVVPLVVAWMMYTGTIDFKPGSTRNFGELVQPPQRITWSGITVDGKMADPGEYPFAGHWLVLHAVPNPCLDACLETVTDLRQVHRAAGRDQSRIRLALLHDLRDPAAADRLREIYSEFHLVENPDRGLWQALQGLARPDGGPGSSRGNSFLVDPMGNIMMRYPAGSDPNGLKRDLKRLLTWSKLDEHQ